MRESGSWGPSVSLVITPRRRFRGCKGFRYDSMSMSGPRGWAGGQSVVVLGFRCR